MKLGFKAPDFAQLSIMWCNICACQFGAAHDLRMVSQKLEQFSTAGTICMHTSLSLRLLPSLLLKIFFARASRGFKSLERDLYRPVTHLLSRPGTPENLQNHQQALQEFLMPDPSSGKSGLLLELCPAVFGVKPCDSKHLQTLPPGQVPPQSPLRLKVLEYRRYRHPSNTWQPSFSLQRPRD